MNEITLDAVVDNVGRVTDFVNEALEAADCPPKAVMQIDVAVDEIFANIALYAATSEKNKARVRVRIVDRQDGGRRAEIEFADEGAPFDPLANEDPDISLAADDREIGGLGILLVKKLTDDVAYRREDNMNVLTIGKNF